METLILHDDSDPSSLTIGLDKDAKKGFIFARANDTVTQFPRLETDFQAFSISLLNSSDLGVIVDNSGLTTIHELTVEGALTAGNGCFSIDGANNINLTGNILLHGTDASTPVVIKPDGSASFANGVVTIQPDGTLQAPKFKVNPDGSMQLGEALSIDQNGIMTQNGGNINVLATYDMVFEGGGPIVTGDNGTTKYRFKVDIHGAPYAEVVS